MRSQPRWDSHSVGQQGGPQKKAWDINFAGSQQRWAMLREMVPIRQIRDSSIGEERISRHTLCVCGILSELLHLPLLWLHTELTHSPAQHPHRR